MEIKYLFKIKVKKMVIIKLIAGIILGGLTGFAYYKFIGCRTGACPITSNPWISTVYGMIMGTLIALL